MAMQKHPEKIIFEYSRPGRGAFGQWPTERDTPNEIAADIPENLRRKKPAMLPEVERARSGAPFHQAVAAQLLHRHAFLSAGIVHDEVQPQGV